MSRKMIFNVLTLSLLLTACGPIKTPQPAPVSTEPAIAEAPTAAPTRETITLTDGLGREVTLHGPAQRVVSLAPSNTEILFAVGAGDQVVGRDELSDYPQQAQGLQSVGGSLGEFNQEAIVALKPDLVLAAEINPPELAKALEDLGLTVYYLSNPTTLEGMFANLEVVGKLTGHEAEATALVESLRDRVAATDERVAAVTEKPTVFYELDSTDPTKPWTAGPGSFVDLLISRAGGQNIGAQLPSAWAQLSLEQLVVANPDIIVLGDSAYGETPETLKARSGWDTLDAVKNSRIFPFNDDLVSRPGPRLVDGLEALAKLLHPELFR
jgi:iron complex transport system substrate-binding protein